MMIAKSSLGHWSKILDRNEACLNTLDVATLRKLNSVNAVPPAIGVRTSQQAALRALLLSSLFFLQVALSCRYLCL
jgi:hypothetical protein